MYYTAAYRHRPLLLSMCRVFYNSFDHKLHALTLAARSYALWVPHIVLSCFVLELS